MSHIIRSLCRPLDVSALGALASAMLLSACGLAPPESGEEPQARTPILLPQGMSLQGMSLQGMSLQGTSLQGMSLQGMSLQGMSLQGMSLQGMSLQGTSLQGMSLQGMSLQGTSLQGTQLLATDATGAPVSLRIANVQTDPQDKGGEITLYALEAWNQDTGAWQNVCSPDPWGERWAIPVSGSWNATGAHVKDDTRVTFGCTSGVIAKCVRWGYKPWKTIGHTALSEVHQACTRMARADYCGDGQSWTQNGTLIDMYDVLGIQTQTPNSGMYLEGQWTTNGASCLGKLRWDGLISATAKPACVNTARLTTKNTDQACIPVQDVRGEAFLTSRSFVNVAQ